MVRHLVVTLLCTTLTSAALVPTAGIYRPPWINLRKARGTNAGTLNNQNQRSVPRPVSPHNPQIASSMSVGRSFSGTGSGYLVSSASYPAFEMTIAPSSRFIYASISPPRSYFALPTFTKRVDEVNNVKSQTAPTPCSLLSQQKGTSNSQTETPDSSHLYPIYVLPPKNFQPIVYQANSLYQPLPVQVLRPVTTNRKGVSGTINPAPEEALWYEKGEARTPSEGTAYENDIEQSRRIFLIPVSDNALHPFPIYESTTIQTAVEKSKPEKVFGSESIAPNAKNPYNKPTTVATEDVKPEKKDSRRLKTKLPVGMTSFFLGGVRGVSGRHWKMPSEIVRQMEFMPNASPVSPESKYLPEDGYVTKQIYEKPQPIPGPDSGSNSQQPGYVTEIEEEEAKGTLVPNSKDANDISDRGDTELPEPNTVVGIQIPNPGVKGIEEPISLTH